MRLTIESTNEFVMIDGVQCRVWRGRTESGRPVDVFCRRMVSADPAAVAELMREFGVVPPPVEANFAEVAVRHMRELDAEN